MFATTSNKGKVLSAALLIIGTTSSQLAAASTQDIVNASNQASLSLISHGMDYNEYGDGRLGSQVGILDSENGQMGGLKIALALMSDKHYGVHHFLKASASTSSGNMAYTGQSLSGGGYGSFRFSHSNTTQNLDAAYGIGIDFADSLMIGPIAEVGYRNWDRGINNGEIYTNSYVAGGLFVKYSPIEKLVFSGTATAGHTQGSNIEVVPLQYYGGFSGPLGNSAIKRFSLSVDYGFTEKIHGHFGIDSARYNYGASKTYATGLFYSMWEPRSTTVETETSFGLGYAF